MNTPFNNRQSIANLVSANHATLDIIRSPKTNKVFFTCGTIVGYVSKKAEELITKGCAMQDLEYAEVTTDDGTVIPTIFPRATANVVASFGASLLK